MEEGPYLFSEKRGSGGTGRRTDSPEIKRRYSEDDHLMAKKEENDNSKTNGEANYTFPSVRKEPKVSPSPSEEGDPKGQQRPDESSDLPQAASGSVSPTHEWTFEEQFKQLYDLSDDSKRKEFLDDLFSFMQERGTPVNRIPIMAKQTLDLYELYRLVVAKGGLVEVINKKLWREITKGLNLPSSITSAAFTLRTQYMKYLYPYECEKVKLSSPSDLQSAIDGNRREGRRSSYTAPMFLHSPGSPPPSMVPHNHSSRLVNHAAVANGSMVLSGDEDSLPPTPTHRSLSFSQTLMLEAEREKRRGHENALPHIPNSAVHIKMTGTNTREAVTLIGGTDNTMIVSIELNGVLYQGVLYAIRAVGSHPLPHSISSMVSPNRNSTA